MQQLYAIEKHGRDDKMNFDEIYQLRQQQAVPILEPLGKWMKEAYTQMASGEEVIFSSYSHWPDTVFYRIIIIP